MSDAQEFCESVHVRMSTFEDGSRIGLHLKSCGGRSSMSGLFNKDRLTGMLWTADMKSIYMITSIAVALIELVSEKSNMCPIPTMFSNYIDIMSADLFKIQ